MCSIPVCVCVEGCRVFMIAEGAGEAGADKRAGLCLTYFRKVNSCISRIYWEPPHGGAMVSLPLPSPSHIHMLHIYIPSKILLIKSETMIELHVRSLFCVRPCSWAHAKSENH